jgi:hypothetical protein
MRRVLAAMALMATVATASAGEVADNAAKAEAALASGDVDGALAAWDAAQESLWNALPFTVRNVQFVNSAEAIGIYDARKDNVFKQGEKLLFYMEPLGYKFGNDGLGNYAINLSFDVELLAESGETVFKQTDFSAIKLASRKKNREMFAKFDLSIDGAPVGKYTAKLTVRDKNGDGSAPITMPFEIVQ